jgi:hypothetical protein
MSQVRNVHIAQEREELAALTYVVVECEPSQAPKVTHVMVEHKPREAGSAANTVEVAVLPAQGCVRLVTSVPVSQNSADSCEASSSQA